MACNQVQFKGVQRPSIPDLVVFINGIPMAVIECKASKERAQSKAIDDLLYYQNNSEKLFHFNHICVGIARNAAAVYEAQEVHYSDYRDEDLGVLSELLAIESTKQDILIWNLFPKNRFLDILKNFVIFEKSKGKTIKKLPRYQQLRATNRTVSKLKEKDEGGVIWHTQGSGKSITMSYIARKLQAEENGFENPTTLILTDRIDLDSQISDLFVNTGFQNVHKARAAKHLQGLLNNSYGGIITTTVQRFMEREEPQENTEITRKKNSEGQIVLTIKFFNEEQKIHS